MNVGLTKTLMDPTPPNNLNPPPRRVGSDRQRRPHTEKTPDNTCTRLQTYRHFTPEAAMHGEHNITGHNPDPRGRQTPLSLRMQPREGRWRSCCIPIHAPHRSSQEKNRIHSRRRRLSLPLQHTFDHWARGVYSRVFHFPMFDQSNRFYETYIALPQR